MHGNPLLRSAIMALLLLLLAWPVWRITHVAQPSGATATEPVVESPAKPAPASSQVQVSADFAPAAQQFVLKYLGQVVASIDHPGSHWQGTINLGAPGDQSELVVVANWGARTEASALHLRLEPAGHPVIEKNFWSNGPLLETVPLN